MNFKRKIYNFHWKDIFPATVKCPWIPAFYIRTSARGQATEGRGNFDMAKRTTVSTKMSAENKAMRIIKSGKNRRLEHSVLVWEQISQKLIKSEDEKEKKKERKKEKSLLNTWAKKQVEILKTKRRDWTNIMINVWKNI
jgi:hypothetical protein